MTSDVARVRSRRASNGRGGSSDTDRQGLEKLFESVCHQTSWLESLVSLNNSRASVAIGGGADTGAGKVFLSLFFFATQMYVSEF